MNDCVLKMALVCVCVCVCVSAHLVSKHYDGSQYSVSEVLLRAVPLDCLYSRNEAAAVSANHIAAVGVASHLQMFESTWSLG